MYIHYTLGEAQTYLVNEGAHYTLLFKSRVV